MSSFTSKIAEARKALVVVAEVAAQLITVGVVHGTAEHVVQVVLGVLAAVGVYAIPNKKPAAK